MYNRDIISDLESFVVLKNGIADKAALALRVQQRYSLIKERSVFYGKWFAIRFCRAASSRFSNVVLSLSTLHKYDGKSLVQIVADFDPEIGVSAASEFLEECLNN